MRTTHSRTIRGFTMLELMVTMTIMAVVAVVVIPQMRNDDRLRVIGASQILTSDLEAAQVLTISYPDQPIIVRFDLATSTYWLAEAATPNTPIIHQPSGTDYLVAFGTDRAVSAQGVTMTLTGVTNNTITFAPSGGLDDFTTVPIIRLQKGDSAIELVIAPTTGTVIEQSVDPQSGGAGVSGLGVGSGGGGAKGK